MEQSETSLSDLMLTYIREGDRESYLRFLLAFKDARLGVNASGALEGARGDIISTTQNPISIGRIPHGEEDWVILAFADPPTFAQNYGVKFNAEMSGQSIFETVLMHPDCSGVRVNCATEELSVIIDRKRITSVLNLIKSPKESSPWWKFW